MCVRAARFETAVVPRPTSRIALPPLYSRSAFTRTSLRCSPNTRSSSYHSVFNHVLDHYIFEGKADAAVSRGFTTLPVSVLVSVRRREAGDPSMRQAECR